MDDVFGRLMDEVNVPDEARSATLATLHALRVRYPQDTPARLLYRARREGAAIPASRCPHGVVHGQCVGCDARIGTRYYATASGTYVHTTPKCGALGSAADGAAPTGGKREPVDVVAVDEGRDRCPQCIKAPARARAPRKPATSQARSIAPKHAPAELTPDSPPAVGDRLDWGGYSGVITSIGDRGVSVSVDGVTLTAPWGDRATVRRKLLS